MNQKKLKVLLTGSTGMVGEGVLHECLQSENIEKVISLSRRPCNVSHPKLTEIIHQNFNDLSSVEQYLKNIDSCFFCLGVSSIGLSEEEYKPLTYDLTMHVAETLVGNNKECVFCYISGAGTDSSEKGRSMWARVKGKTENDLMKLGFKNVFNFRPAVLKPTKGLKRTVKPYKYFGWMIPVVQTFFPHYICSLKELALAMIHVSVNGYPKNILEVEDIIAVAKTN